ncbi:MAG: VWA domain-containing protein [Bdellovibrionaceae bacterium]|nr:VWA domain-containing protein [Pseudobdellovibrionaceae bacterium]
MSFRFANPAAFQWLWLIPVMIVLFVAVERRARRRLANALGSRVAPFLTASVAPGRRRFKLFLRCLALIFFVVAYARPQMGKSEQKIKSEGVELVIAFDVSTSMLAEDIRPSRMELAKAEVARLLDMLSGDKVGLVAFAGSAVLVSPLTNDKSALRMFLDGLSTISVETQGTDIRKALREAKGAFERGGVDPEEDVKVTRVVLVVSDGEDHEPGAMEEARAMVNEGMRIFTVLVGTEQGAPIPIRDERGYIQGYKKDRNRNEIVSKTKGTVLQELASAGKGGFFQLTFGGREMKMIKDDLNKLEKAEFDSQLQTNFDERYQGFLLVGFLLALAELLIGERKSDGRLWRGRFEVKQS